MLRKELTNRLLLVENDLRELRESARELESEQRLLQVEWAETHRKVINTLRSLARSGGKRLPQEEEQPTLPLAHSGPDEISARIHARRNRALSNTESETGG